MRLTYRLLWLENNALWAESLEDELNEIIEDDYGFMLEKTIVPKHEDTINYNAYDLILMDLNLQDDLSGDKLIQKIRNNKIYTDIIFYSADGIPAIKEKARELNLEGVYFSSRTKHLFLSKVKAIVETTIRKVQDLNNLRGLVMAEVSELDARMSSLIEIYYIQNGTVEKTTQFKKHLVDDVEKATKKKLSQSENCDKQCKHKWNEFNIEQIVQDFEFDASRKARAIKLLIESISFPYETKNGNFYEDYRIDMLNMRNQLAHCVSSIKDGKEILITKNGEIVYDEIKFKEIREQIKLYNIVFDDIEERIR